MHDATDIDSLLALIRTGATPRYFHFWGHTPRLPDEIDKSCLSQWYPAQFEIGGTPYATSEHYMMAEKASLFGSTAVAERIRSACSPAEAKKLGQKVENYDEDRWVAARFGIVLKGNLAKFEQNKDCLGFLLATGNRVLVEASPVDPIWGIGLAADHPDASSPEKWGGLNLLGFALMHVRSQLRCAQS